MLYQKLYFYSIIFRRQQTDVSTLYNQPLINLCISVFNRRKTNREPIDLNGIMPIHFTSDLNSRIPFDFLKLEINARSAQCTCKGNECRFEFVSHELYINAQTKITWQSDYIYWLICGLILF